MSTLGTTSKPTDAIEWFGSGNPNQIAVALTLPAGGPWNITDLHAWIAGRGATATYKLCLWSTGGSLVRSGASDTVASQALALGNLELKSASITPYEVPGGTTVIVGFWRDNGDPVQSGYDTGGTHYHDVGGASSPSSLAGFTTHSGTHGYYLTYEAANSAPSAPVIVAPTSGQVVASETPLIDWTFSDPDGDTQGAYQVQVDDFSDFRSPLDTGIVASATTQWTVSSPLFRGSTYYARVKVRDASLWSGWSATRTFKIASLPTATVTSPGTDTAAPLYYNAGADTTPKIRPVWTFNCPDGGTQTSALIRVYDAAGTTSQGTNLISSAATTGDSSVAVTNGTIYQVAVTPTCSHGLTGSESTMKRCKVRWGRASYRADLGSTPITLSVDSNSTLNSGQVVLEYGSTSGTSPEPTDWKATISEVTKQRYVWHRVTLLPQAVASPTSPALNDITFSYSANVLTPDKWTIDAAFAVDTGDFVYGTQSMKHTGDGTTNYMTQTVPVVPDTDYILSGRVKTDGAAGASLLLRDAGGATLASVAADSSTDWTRYKTAVWNSGAATSVEVALACTGASSTYAWFDALKLEASLVATPWTPGFLGTAVSLDAGGIMVDASLNGIFRLRGSTGGTRDVVTIGTNGLKFGGDTEVYSPNTGGLSIGGYGRLRFVPVSRNTIIDVTRTSADTEHTVTISSSLVPDTAKAVLLDVRLAQTVGTITVGVGLVSHGDGTNAGTVYTGAGLGFYNSNMMTVGLVSRQFRYTSGWGAGTTRMIIGVSGYWTDDIT